jgi:hypothetical protein
MSKPFTAEDAEKGFNLRVKSKNDFDVDTLATFVYGRVLATAGYAFAV